MIARVWHGWTARVNADAYEALLKFDIFPAIARRGIAGYRGVELLRRAAGDEVEFVSVMRFETMESVKQFAGEDFGKAVVPPAACALLQRFDQLSAHYEIRSESTPATD